MGKKLTWVRKRQLIELSVVLAITTVFIFFTLSINHVNKINTLFETYEIIFTHELLVNVIFLSLIGLLWITYRRWREATKRQKELEDIIESISPDVLMVVDPDRNIIMCNPSVKRMFGYEVDEVLNQKTEILYSDRRSNPEQQHEIYNILEQEGFHVGLATGKKKNGKTIPLETITGNLFGRNGAVLLLRDITDRKQLQEQLIQSEKMSALGQLISGVAHELNNPMTGVLGFSQLLLQSADLPENLKQSVERIDQEAKRARKIVQNLLTFARQQPPEKRKIDVNELVGRILDMREYELNVSNIEVIRNFDQDLPTLWADEYQLQQVFMNLIINAEQAMLESYGNGQLEVTTQWDKKQNVAQIVFRDTGPGIAEEHLSKIFDPFFTTKPVGKGTGLGLSITYGIVQEHGGSIIVVSEKNCGATFTVELPVVEGETSEIFVTPSPAKETGDIGKKKVLVVDDESSIVALLRETLKKEGYDVETALDGLSAIQKINEDALDAVVSDLKIPGKDGTDIYRYCKKKRPDLARRFLIITGDVVTTDYMKFFKEQKVAFIPKPFDIKDFVSSFNNLFQFSDPYQK